MPPPPLDGLRVVEQGSGVAAPLAGMLLADFGAEVVKVEPLGGDPERGTPAFEVFNRGKASVVIDPADSLDRLEALVAGADLCIAGGPAAALSGTPLDPALALARNRRLVHLHVAPYTDDAPWAGGAESESLLGAAAGVALRQFSFDGGPVDDVYAHVLTVQGVWAAACAVAALHERESSGAGQAVTVSGLHGVMIAAAGALTFDQAAPVAEGPRPGGPGGPVPYYRLYRCGDDEWLFLASLTPRFTERAFAVLGVDDLMTDERLGPRPRAAMLRPEHAAWVIDRIASVFAARPRHEWLDRLARAGVPAGPVLGREDWLDHPQLSAIGMRVELDDAAPGAVVMPGVPLKLSATPGSVRGPAPVLDVGAEVWAAPEPGGNGRRGGSRAEPGRGPLHGIRVLDLGAIIAGPFAASLLGELGAEVVKVEPPAGDSFRGPGFACYNKGQRSVVVDLTRPEGRDLLMHMAASADVVVDNYRPGVLGRLGVTYDDLRAVNNDIVTVTVTGFGEGGPLGDEPGFDPILQAMSGMMDAQGGDDDPVFFTIPVNDVAAASTAALGACLALFHRRRGGGGQKVTTSLAAMSALLQARELTRWPGSPPPPRGGRDHPGPGPVDRYHRVGDGWVRAQPAGGVEAPAELLGELAGLDRATAVGALEGAGVAAAPARRVGELTADPEVTAYRVVEPHPSRPGWWTTGPPARFSRTSLPTLEPASDLAQHTDDVLAEHGLSEGERAALRDAGVIK
ncbi:MAG TPA: CoA transferase [Acidimicrobiales bacterium]|nr:CoA transferase [Acidimicrobiales bacterium]